MFLQARSINRVKSHGEYCPLLYTGQKQLESITFSIIFSGILNTTCMLTLRQMQQLFGYRLIKHTDLSHSLMKLRSVKVCNPPK